jgi:SAM-dependent methyltransferase
MSFRRDLFRGTASSYDRYRPTYPPKLINHLSERAVVPAPGTYLDLACGPGTLTFALQDRFAETWAVDQEPDMVDVARAKAAGLAGTDPITGIRCIESAAEDLIAPPETFDLVTIGNAFHRMRREVVAARIFGWLRPGGHLALVWGGSPWQGSAPWQQAMHAVMDRWRPADRIPSGYEQDRENRPDLSILADTGFELIGTHEFQVTRDWTLDDLAGFLSATSTHSPAALADRAAAFEADLRASLQASTPAAVYPQQITFAYDLARRPSPHPHPLS